LTVDGEKVVLLALRPDETGVAFRLMNTSVEEPATAVIGSELIQFRDVGAGQRSPGDRRPARSAGVTVELMPGQIKTVTLGFGR